MAKTTVKAKGNIIAETSQIKGVSKLSPFIRIAIRAAMPPTVGGGEVVSFEIDGDFETTTKFVDNLKLCFSAASLGGAEALAMQPVTCSHYFVGAEDRKKAGITDQLVRLALGIEDSEDIIADLEQAFNEI